MMTVSQVIELKLAHDAGHTASADTGHVVVLSHDGAATLISPDFKETRNFTVAKRANGVALSPDGALLAVATDAGATILSAATFETSRRLDGSCQGCLFGGDKLFWMCNMPEPGTLVLEAWDMETWARIARCEVADPFGESSVMLWPHPERNSVVLFAGAGQEGQCLIWGTLDGTEIHTTVFDAVDETSLPSFSLNGEEFLVTTHRQLRRYSYPQGELRASLTTWAGKENGGAGIFVSYVGANHAVMESTNGQPFMNGRMLVVNIAEMSVESEVEVPGLNSHEHLGFLLPMPGGKFVLCYRRLEMGAPATGSLRLFAPKLD
jgi:hypothetical protein